MLCLSENICTWAQCSWCNFAWPHVEQIVVILVRWHISRQLVLTKAGYDYPVASFVGSIEEAVWCAQVAVLRGKSPRIALYGRYRRLNEIKCFLHMHDWPRLLVLQEFPARLSHEMHKGVMSFPLNLRENLTMDFSRHVLPASDVSCGKGRSANDPRQFVSIYGCLSYGPKIFTLCCPQAPNLWLLSARKITIQLRCKQWVRSVLLLLGGKRWFGLTRSSIQRSITAIWNPTLLGLERRMLEHVTNACNC